MLRLVLLALVVLVPMASPASGQFGPAGQDPTFRAGSPANLLNARISDQRISRQTEVDRLENLLRSFETRVITMERQLLQMSRLPAITIEEAEAAVEFATAQLKDSEDLFDKGDSSELQVKRHRLDLARARGQLKAAKASQEESLVIAELELAYARRAYLQQTNEQEQLERFVAKGYTSPDVLRLRVLDVDLAEKRLKLAQLRLDAQRESMINREGVPATSKEVEDILSEQPPSTTEQ